MQRIFGFMDPWADPFGKGYQLSHALIAFGRGEWLGVGLGASVEKLFYLPEAHTDFLLAVIARNSASSACRWSSAVLVAGRCARSRSAARRWRSSAPSPALVAQGIGMWLGVQALINMGVNMGVLPTKGLTLPLHELRRQRHRRQLLSRSAVLLRIDWENRQLMRGRHGE